MVSFGMIEIDVTCKTRLSQLHLMTSLHALERMAQPGRAVEVFTLSDETNCPAGREENMLSSKDLTP